jgi:hypothetical protein
MTPNTSPSVPWFVYETGSGECQDWGIMGSFLDCLCVSKCNFSPSGNGVIFVESRQLPQHINMGYFPGKKRVDIYIFAVPEANTIPATEHIMIESN